MNFINYECSQNNAKDRMKCYNVIQEIKKRKEGKQGEWQMSEIKKMYTVHWMRIAKINERLENFLAVNNN